MDVSNLSKPVFVDINTESLNEREKESKILNKYLKLVNKALKFDSENSEILNAKKKIEDEIQNIQKGNYGEKQNEYTQRSYKK